MSDIDREKDAATKPIDSEKTEPLRWLLNATKSLFFVSLTCIVGLSSYLLWTNPRINEPLNQRVTAEEQANAEEKSAEPRKWSYDPFSEVNTTSEQYPIVVLRTGFKVIRVGSEHSLVGWKYEMINTSPITKYVPTIEFVLIDSDGFNIAKGTSDTILQPSSYGVATGTISIANVDMERLHDSSWTINLRPDWEFAEKDTTGTRYSRLKEIANETIPYWATEQANEEVMGLFSEKWKAIQKGLEITFEGEKADDAQAEEDKEE